MAIKLQVMSVDALAYDDGWEYNDQHNMFSFWTEAKDICKAFRRALNRKGYKLSPAYQVTEDRNTSEAFIEVLERKTGRPVLCAVETDIRFKVKGAER